MRIISGRLGGRRLRAPKGDLTRPTSDKVREALFSILGPPPPDTRVLDAFAGAGALGLEAVSRGATWACFIDSSAAAVRCVRDNIAALGLDDVCEVWRGDAVALVQRWSRAAAAAPGAPGAPATGRFRWVFVDPPYQSDLAAKLLRVLVDGMLLTADATVIVEHNRNNQPDVRCGCLVKADSRRYGDTLVSLYRPSLPRDSTDETLPHE